MKRLFCLFALALNTLSFYVSAVEGGDNENITQENLIQKAIQYNDSDLLEILQKYGLNPNDSKPILNKAMDAEDYRAVMILVEYGVDINSRHEKEDYDKSFYSNTGKLLGSIYSIGKTVLEQAVGKQDLELVEYFLSKKANPLSKRKIKEWKYKENPNIKNKIDEDVYEYITTAVYDAIQLGRLDILILFKQYGTDLNAICFEESINKRPAEKFTPIQAALRLGQKDIVMFLISQDVKI